MKNLDNLKKKQIFEKFYKYYTEEEVDKFNKFIQWTLLCGFLGIVFVSGIALQCKLRDDQKNGGKYIFSWTNNGQIFFYKSNLSAIKVEKLHRRSEIRLSPKFHLVREPELSHQRTRKRNANEKWSVKFYNYQHDVRRIETRRHKMHITSEVINRSSNLSGEKDGELSYNEHENTTAPPRSEVLKYKHIGERRTKREAESTDYKWDEYDDEEDEPEKEKKLWEKIAEKWKGVAVRVIIGASFALTFCMCCCKCCSVSFTAWRRSQNLGAGAMVTCWDYITCQDPMYKQMKSWAAAFGMKLDYQMYLELKETAEKEFQRREIEKIIPI